MGNSKKEIWKDITDYEGYYQISNRGNVKSLSRFVNGKNGGKIPIKERIMQQGKNDRGYKNAALSKNYKTKYISIQRLVAIAFIQNPENKSQVNHLNGKVDDNRVENLEWCTPSENNKHAYRELGRLNPRPWLGKKGKEHFRSKTVYQYDINNNFIKEYESSCEAAKINGFRQSGISASATGRCNLSFGFKWSYEKL
ncbi:MAG: HNH endonuclease [Flavobacterium sp.]|nr:HNH endonuclease [Flavobacterium sp.]